MNDCCLARRFNSSFTVSKLFLRYRKTTLHFEHDPYHIFHCYARFRILQIEREVKKYSSPKQFNRKSCSGDKNPERKKFLKTIILIACIAFFSIVPPTVYFDIDHFKVLKKSTLATEIFNQIFVFIFYANFAINPLIYVTRLSNYRKTFYVLYSCRKTP